MFSLGSQEKRECDVLAGDAKQLRFTSYRKKIAAGIKR
jgi:hypothetical protein